MMIWGLLVRHRNITTSLRHPKIRWVNKLNLKWFSPFKKPSMIDSAPRCVLGQDTLLEDPLSRVLEAGPWLIVARTVCALLYLAIKGVPLLS